MGTNAPDRFELFLIPEGQSKVEMTMDSKIPNAATFTILKEDHTLGNSLRMQLLKNPKVLFSGYKVCFFALTPLLRAYVLTVKVPHPLEHTFIIKIQTTPDTSPLDVLQSEINKLINELGAVKLKFEVRYIQNELTLHGINTTSESHNGLGMTLDGKMDLAASLHAAYDARTVGPDGSKSKFMSFDQFMTLIDAVAYKDIYRVPRDHYSALFRLADQGSLTKEEFVNFGTILAKPDAEYEIAFRLFDEDADGDKGRITFGQFKSILASSMGKGGVPVQFTGDWIKLYVGAKADKADMSYQEFTELVEAFQSERLQQEFKHYDPKGVGKISPVDLRNVIEHVAGHKLSTRVLERIPSLAVLYSPSQPTSRCISFINLLAVYNVIKNMDIVERVVDAASTASADGRVSKTDFMRAASNVTRFSRLTPMEVDTAFFLASDGAVIEPRLSRQDFSRLFDPHWGLPPPPEAKAALKLHQPAGVPFYVEVLRSMYNFTLGSIAGAVGATVVYPIDLVKTRMQNQRAKVVGELLYKNSLDCFQKVIRNEGVKGLYSGLLPQLVGVAPEKAIKLTMNDLVRGKMKDPETGKIPLYGEIMAGCVAGGSQVVFTNPLEIVKIRLQVQGESAAGGVAKRSALQIVNSLGLVGLYKGAAACLQFDAPSQLRDVPFSGIYFPTYAHLKSDLFHEGKNGKKLSILELLTAGALAGMPAAYLVTPADVIKTRLQVAARKGETTYTGIMDAFVKISREEGVRAFFKGGVARVFRSSPQFGVTLASYELMKTLIPFNLDAAATSHDDKKLTDGPILKPGTLRVVLDLYPDLLKAKQ
ncbi:mitochondrial aspartate-glutamate transporter agc1 [Irineochytrium annulatum]|nr:mitochondrial aspartate-glutamate transporter agc1 [Irineochytrium annulatum]